MQFKYTRLTQIAQISKMFESQHYYFLEESSEDFPSPYFFFDELPILGDTTSSEHQHRDYHLQEWEGFFYPDDSSVYEDFTLESFVNMLTEAFSPNQYYDLIPSSRPYYQTLEEDGCLLDSDSDVYQRADEGYYDENYTEVFEGLSDSSRYEFLYEMNNMLVV